MRQGDLEMEQKLKEKNTHEVKNFYDFAAWLVETTGAGASFSVESRSGDDGMCYVTLSDGDAVQVKMGQAVEIVEGKVKVIK